MNKIRERRQIVFRWLPPEAVGAEIGVFKGDFSETFLAEKKPSKYYLIDPWKNMEEANQKSLYHKGSHNDMQAIYEDVKARFAAQAASGQVEIMRGTAKDMVPKLEDESLDFVYIDGDHSYEGCKLDLDLSYPKVKVGGFIALDDYVNMGWWKDGVVRATNEFIGTHLSKVEIRGAAQGQVVLQKVG